VKLNENRLPSDEKNGLKEENCLRSTGQQPSSRCTVQKNFGLRCTMEDWAFIDVLDFRYKKVSRSNLI
jgi:hypothetical protein